jgi:hypothetical protein
MCMCINKSGLQDFYLLLCEQWNKDMWCQFRQFGMQHEEKLYVRYNTWVGHLDY